MPKDRVPPDKIHRRLENEHISKSVQELYSKEKKQYRVSWSQDLAKQKVVLPSNLDPNVAATNLKNELIGKFKDTNDTEDEANNQKRKRNRKETKHWETKKDEGSTNPVNNIATITNSDRTIGVNEEIIVQLRQVMLPPKPTSLPIPKPKFKVNSKFLRALLKLLTSSSKMVKPKVRFDICMAAAEENFRLLKTNKFNLDKLLNIEGETSVTSYGSEFKTVQELDELFNNHPRWPALRSRLSTGSSWKMMQMDEPTRNKDLEEAINRGNHKSADRNAQYLSSALEKEIKKGWELILPLKDAYQIPGLIISPMGVAEQIGVNEFGEFVPKKRLTHDLSFPGQHSNESVNSRVDDTVLERCMFGHAFLWIVHFIVHLRKLYPNKKIWLRKDDTKSAYRRMHMSATTAVKAGVQLKIDDEDFLLLSLRLPFGGSPCPSEFCLLSDILTDTINDLMNCKEWDPSSMKSDYVQKVPLPKELPSHIPFAEAKEMSVTLNNDESCKSDVFVDDIITVGVDINNNLEKIVAAPCTVMHAVAHKATGQTFIPRQDLIADDKNEAEGGPEETKTILGWEIDSRQLLVKLPSHKFIAWSSQVESFLTRKTANSKDLRSVLGRMENIAIMIPMFGHFLNNIRQLEIKATNTNKNQLINKRAKEDFNLALKFLKRAKEGVNMNLITFRSPTKIYINDASEHGLGGFATHGRAWSYEIPENLRGRAHINLLEFLAQLISIWIDVLEKKTKPLDCLLGMGDNTASMGWLRRSNFRENEEHDLEWLAKQKVARKVATLVLNSGTTLYRQWFKGADNVVADSLSRDAYFLPNKAHELFLLKTVPTQVPKDFKIQPVPKEICSFVTSILQLLPVKQHRWRQQKPSDLAHSNAGLLSSLALELKNCTSKTLQNTNKILSCLPSPKLCKRPLSLVPRGCRACS